MARGIDGVNIFNDDYDRTEFLNRLTGCMKKCRCKCLAWCLMNNHYHLLMRTDENPISRLMRPLNGGYALWFNRKYGRREYLFQDRFKSALCQDQDYAKQLIRYIHLNPIRAMVVKSLKQLNKWNWCGHAFLLGVKNASGAEFQDRLEALRRFSTKESDAIQQYLLYMEQGIDTRQLEKSGELSQTETFEISGSQKGWPAVIGDPEFVRDAMNRHEIGRIRKHRQADYSRVLEKIEKKVRSKFSFDEKALFKRGRRNDHTLARVEFCHVAHVNELLPLSVIARYLNISIPAVSKLINKAERNSRIS